MDYEVLKLLIDILGYNYPETLQTAYVVYAPFLFWACWVCADALQKSHRILLIVYSYTIFLRQS